jgi:hypothetical protein
MAVTPLTATWGLGYIRPQYQYPSLNLYRSQPECAVHPLLSDQGAPNGRRARPRPLLAAAAVSAAPPITVGITSVLNWRYSHFTL